MKRFGSKRRNGKQGAASKKSSKQEWLRELEKHFSVYRQQGNDSKQMVIAWSGGISPGRMPTPAGPTRGAVYTTVECVRLSDMTLPAGSAITGGVVRQGGATDAFASFAFALADIPNISSIGALFDQYRIDEIQFRIKSRNPALFISQTASPNNSSCEPLVVVDRDDNTAPTTLSELQQYDNCQQMGAQDSMDVIFTPSITPSVFSGGAFSGYAVEDSKKYWLDLANTAIPHYGIKMGFPALVTSTTQKFDWVVTAWYKVSFKNKR